MPSAPLSIVPSHDRRTARRGPLQSRQVSHRSDVLQQELPATCVPADRFSPNRSIPDRFSPNRSFPDRSFPNRFSPDRFFPARFVPARLSANFAIASLTRVIDSVPRVTPSIASVIESCTRVTHLTRFQSSSRITSASASMTLMNASRARVSQLTSFESPACCRVGHLGRNPAESITPPGRGRGGPPSVSQRPERRLRPPGPPLSAGLARQPTGYARGTCYTQTCCQSVLSAGSHAQTQDASGRRQALQKDRHGQI